MSAVTSILVALSAVSGWPLHPQPTVAHAFAPPAISWFAGHRGVDLPGDPGQPVLATEAGTVMFAGRIGGKGVVVVSHGGTRTTYEPVAASIHRGEEVAEGQQIGTLELLGSHCFPDACLHWGLVRGTEYLDPLTLLDDTIHVRLLPQGASSPMGAGELPDLATEDGDVGRPWGPAPEVQAALDRLSEFLAGFRASVGLTPGGAPAGTPAAADP